MKLSNILIKILTIFSLTLSINSYGQNATIFFKDYKLKISNISQLGDTLIEYNHSREKFLFVFFDRKGKCYCEKYSHNKLVEKGFFSTTENAIEVLVSARNSKSQTKPIKTEAWFWPVKNGEWHIYQNDIEVKSENYVMGTLQK